MPESLPDHLAVMSETVADWTPDQLRCGDLDGESSPCEIGAHKASVEFVVWGDSHAQATFEALEQAAHHSDTKGLFLSRGACPPLPGFQPEGGGFVLGCPAFNEYAMQTINRLQPRSVILIARWVAYRYPHSQKTSAATAEDAMLALVHTLQESGIRVAIMDEVPYSAYCIPSTFGTGI